MKERASMIDKRRSVRSYSPQTLPEETLAALQARMAQLRPLTDGGRVEGRIVATSQATFLQRWRTPHFIAVFADGTEEGWVNAGFMYQQLELYAQSMGLGTCWVGLSSLNEDVPRPEGLKPVVMMAVGVPEDGGPRSGAADFNRKPMQEITDVPDERLESLRLAPSATNSQPWYVTHEGGVLHIWREELGRIRQRTHGKFNRVDIGIALAHLYVSNPETFRYFREENPPTRAGYLYMGSVTL